MLSHAIYCIQSKKQRKEGEEEKKEDKARLICYSIGNDLAVLLVMLLTPYFRGNGMFSLRDVNQDQTSLDCLSLQNCLDTYSLSNTTTVSQTSCEFIQGGKQLLATLLQLGKT